MHVRNEAVGKTELEKQPVRTIDVKLHKIIHEIQDSISSPNSHSLLHQVTERLF